MRIEIKRIIQMACNAIRNAYIFGMHFVRAIMCSHQGHRMGLLGEENYVYSQVCIKGELHFYR